MKKKKHFPVLSWIKWSETVYSRVFVGLVISKDSVVHKITNLQLFIAVSGALLFVGSIAKCVVVLTSFLSPLSILPKHTLSGSRLGHLSH